MKSYYHSRGRKYIPCYSIGQYKCPGVNSTITHIFNYCTLQKEGERFAGFTALFTLPVAGAVSSQLEDCSSFFCLFLFIYFIYSCVGSSFLCEGFL